MAGNLIQNGNTITFTTVGGVTSGDVVVLGSLVGVANDTIAAGGLATAIVNGVFRVDKANADAFTQGAKAYWDGSEMTTTAGGNTFAGLCWADAGAGTDKVNVNLNYGGGA